VRKPRAFGKEPGDELIRVVEERDERSYRRRDGFDSFVHAVQAGRYEVAVTIAGGQSRYFVSELSTEAAIEQARDWIRTQRARKDGGVLARSTPRIKVHG
jgi:hypothetical protein